MDRPRLSTIIWLGLAIGALVFWVVTFGFSPTSNHPATSTPSPHPFPSASPTPTTVPASPTSRPSPTVAATTSPLVAGTLVVTSEAEQSVTLIDTATGKAVKTLHLGAPLGRVVIGPDGRSAWVFSDQPGASDFYVIDLDAQKVQTSKRLYNLPDAAAFSADGSRAFVALEDTNSVSFLNAATRDVFGSVAVGTQSSGVQMHRQIRDLTVARGTSGNVLFVAGQGSGAVWALDPGSGKLLTTVEVGGGPTYLLPAPGRNQIYAVADTIDQIVGIDTRTLTVSARIGLPGQPSGAAISAKGVIAVSGGDSGELWMIEPATGTTVSTVRVGARPAGVAFSADGNRAYVANEGDGTVSIVDVATNRAIATLRAGKEPVGLAFAAPPFATPSLAGVNGAQPRPVATPKAIRGKPTAIPTLVPTPTPLPSGATPVSHLPPNVVKETFVANANFPVSLAFAPDGRLFYAERQTGKIRLVKKGVLLPDSFYQLAVAGEPETGLLGLTLYPDFARNHYVYVFYTSVAGGGTQSGGTNGPNEVVRLTDVNDRGTDLTSILRNLPSGPIHDSGGLRFGPDGKLYVSLGDTDNGNNAQDLSSPAGKILRVNPDGSIPKDNPFAGQRGKDGRIWAYGIRNTFRFAFDPISHGLFGGDNGPGDNDEINLIVKGGNYGWPPAGYQNKAGLIDPLEVMNPPIAPTGMAFYVGDQIPGWKNDLFYCDYHQSQLRRIRLAPESLDRIISDEVVTPGCTLDVTTGPDGALYFTDLSGIYRLQQKGASALPVVSSAGSPTPIPTESLPAGTRPADRDVNITLTEWRLTPSRTRIPAGTIVFLAENVGSTTHALRIVGPGVDVRTANIAPGQSALLTVTLKAGTYTLTCPVPGHAQQGMRATINVVGR